MRYKEIIENFAIGVQAAADAKLARMARKEKQLEEENDDELTEDEEGSEAS